MNRKKIMWSDWIAAMAAASVGAGLIVQSATVSQGIQNGLKVCAGVLIPALFPFMVLSGFLSLTSAARILSIPLMPVTTRIFKLPEKLGAIVLLSLIGGYPVGAKSISLLLSQKKITRETAERMLCFCVNSGPSFLITAVGMGLLHNKTAGIILFFTQTAATLLIGAAVSFRAKIPPDEGSRIEMRKDEAFVEAVSSASYAMITMCSFAILFSGILALVTSSGLADAARHLPLGKETVNAVINGFFEVTSGCISAAQISGEAGFCLISAIVSFGGLSVLFQIMSCFRGNPVSFRPLILARFFHILLSTTMALPLYRYFCATQTVFAPRIQPMISVDTKTVLISVALLCMCAILTTSSRQHR